MAKRTSKKTSKSSKAASTHNEVHASSPDHLNRDLGWLNFNARVLHEARDERTPLLERLRFISIFYSNLDEFFMKRVGNLKRHVSAGGSHKTRDGLSWSQVFQDVKDKMVLLIQEGNNTFESMIRNQLKKNNIELLNWSDLSDSEKSHLQNYFRKQVFPVLIPLSVDSGHPFPFISNLSTSLGISLCYPDREDKFFARVKIPGALPQWIRTDSTNYRFISLLELVRAHIHELFPSMKIISVMPFRVTRDSEIDRDEEDVEDLLEMIEEEVKQRRFASIVRIEYLQPGDPWILKFLQDELELSKSDLYETPAPLDFRDFRLLADLDMPLLKYEPWFPRIPTPFLDEALNVFSLIKTHDILIHSPYESFSATVERMLNEASLDPKVLAIKMTLYRTGDNSPFVKALIHAAETGKQVVCLVELKARFDEERNILWAQELESAGVHVVYGIVGLKTHTKTLLIVRQEEEGLKCYCHIGTGNYNSVTARLYTDLGLLTSKESITSEVLELFNFLTGRSLHAKYQTLLVAPVNMFQRFQELIEQEKNNALEGHPAQIIAKFNSLEERQISQSLYKASQAGVNIDLIVRGFCCLRPQVTGLSEKIRVISIIGRFLEHSRIYYFRAKAADPIDGEFYIGSADWMHRNLHTRVETLVPVVDRVLKEKLWDILQTMLNDKRQAWDMLSNGEYVQRSGGIYGTQSTLMNVTKIKYGHQIEDLKNDSESDKKD